VLNERLARKANGSDSFSSAIRNFPSKVERRKGIAAAQVGTKEGRQALGRELNGSRPSRERERDFADKACLPPNLQPVIADKVLQGWF
jgi:hypothetical protein